MCAIVVLKQVINSQEVWSMLQSLAEIQKSVQREFIDPKGWRKHLDFDSLQELMKSEAARPHCRLFATYDLRYFRTVDLRPLVGVLGLQSSEQLNVYKAPDLREPSMLPLLFRRDAYELRVVSPKLIPGVLRLGALREGHLRTVLAIDVRNCCYAKLDFVSRLALVSEQFKAAVLGLGFEFIRSSGPSDLSFLNRVAAYSEAHSDDSGEFGLGGEYWKEGK